MRWPLVTRSTHNKVLEELGDTRLALAKERTESASWRVEYRKIRDRIVDIATHPQATPQIKATLMEFTGSRP